MTTPLRHVLTASQFTPAYLNDELFPRVDLLREVHAVGDSRVLTGRRMFWLFFQPSTRTRISFESAMTLLGGTVTGSEISREQRERNDEPIEDRIRVIASYDYDVILLRYHEEGGAARAASVSPVSVINAGDGDGEHPTQAMLDAYTIRRELGRLQDLHVAFVGDLTYERSVNSLAELLGAMPDVRLSFVSPSTLRIRPSVRDRLSAIGARFEELEDMAAVVPTADVLYITRAHGQRMDMAQRFDTSGRGYSVDDAVMSALSASAIVMHPLPRGPELPMGIEADPRIACFRQAENGLFVRMALLTKLLERRSD